MRHNATQCDAMRAGKCCRSLRGVLRLLIASALQPYVQEKTCLQLGVLSSRDLDHARAPNKALGWPGLFEHVQGPPGMEALRPGPVRVSALEGKLADLGSLTAISKHGPNLHRYISFH